MGCWPAAYPAFATFDPGAMVNQAHTDWLQWTAEGGLPVGIAMLSLALWAIRPAIRSIWGIGVIAVLIHAAFDYPFSRPAVGAWPILILSMAAVGQRTNPGANPDENYSGLTVDDLPPPKPKATPTTAPAARATMTRIFVVSLCGFRGGGAGALLPPEGLSLPDWRRLLALRRSEGLVSPEGAGAPAGGGFPVGVGLLRATRSAASGECRRPTSLWKPPPPV